MRLRAIITILTITSLFVSLIGGYVFYNSLRKTALNDSHRKVGEFTRSISLQIDLIISERQKIAKGLAAHKELSDFLSHSDPQSLKELNSLLDLFQESWDISVCYLMDESGNTLASSNRNSPESFVGKNYAFRPYFIKAMEGESSVYMAVGVTSGRRGIFFSYPVYIEGRKRPSGVAVVKSSITELENKIEQAHEGVMSVVGPHSVIFVTSRQDWLYHTLWPVSKSTQREISASRQFGTGPWKWTGLRKDEKNRAIDRDGNKYNVHTSEIVMSPGWKIVYLHSYEMALSNISGPVLRIAGYIITTFCAVIIVSLFILYKKADQDLKARKMLEEKLRAISITDELTGLYNRRGFYNFASHQFNSSYRNKNKMCLYYIDMDDLKVINDKFGHVEGDRAIADVAQLLKSTFRKSDIIGRLGGDEFAVLMDCDATYKITDVKKRLSDGLNKLNDEENRSYKLSISTGLVISDPTNPMEFDEFISNADKQMYRQKRSKTEQKS